MVITLTISVKIHVLEMWPYLDPQGIRRNDSWCNRREISWVKRWATSQGSTTIQNTYHKTHTNKSKTTKDPIWRVWGGGSALGKIKVCLMVGVKHRALSSTRMLCMKKRSGGRADGTDGRAVRSGGGFGPIGQIGLAFGRVGRVGWMPGYPL